MNSWLYTGWVRHRRFAPVKHEFRYRIAQPLLDLAELDEAFGASRLWSVERPNVVSFRRSDHVGDPRVPLDTAVRDLVEQRTGARPAGPIRLLTHPRYFGYVMNPVSLYYCYDCAGETVQAIVAELHNTPWGERHCYVLDSARNEGDDRNQRFRFAKEFHVSPFIAMDVDYDWRFTAPGDRLSVHMTNLEGGRPTFDATMVLDRQPMTARALRGALVRFPFMTGAVIGAIYWQALRLWIKGVPVHDHPKPEAQ